MTDAQDRRAKFYEDRGKAVDTHEQRAFEYEKLAIDYSNSAFRVLTYLNGGALIAIPAVLTLLNWDASRHKSEIVTFAGLFVVGLVAILLAQMCAFFTMARRAEAQQSFAAQQSWHSAMTHYPEQFEYNETKAKADAAGATGNSKLATSDKVRAAAIGFAWGSAGAFIAGCVYAAFVLVV
jgi:cytosine/uracil/thiamine/allantoin permease